MKNYIIQSHTSFATSHCTYSVKHVGVGATTPDRLCSTDPKRRGLLNMYLSLLEDRFPALVSLISNDNLE